MIPKAVSVEGTAPKAIVLEGATTVPEVPIALEPMKEVHDDTLPEASIVGVLDRQPTKGSTRGR
jgi:hypothetical protein